MKSNLISASVVLLIFLMLVSCSKDKSTESITTPTTNALIGVWEITTILFDGNIVNIDLNVWYWGTHKNVDLTFMENGLGVASVTTDALYEYDFTWVIEDNYIEFDATNGLYGFYPYTIISDTLTLFFERPDPVTNQFLVEKYIYIKMK